MAATRSVGTLCGDWRTLQSGGRLILGSTWQVNVYGMKTVGVLIFFFVIMVARMIICFSHSSLWFLATVKSVETIIWLILSGHSPPLPCLLKYYFVGFNFSVYILAINLLCCKERAVQNIILIRDKSNIHFCYFL